MRKIGLALGGGGARGFAHIGLLKVIEQEKIPIYCISGTSMGAIIGACYAVNPRISIVENRIREIIVGPLMEKMKFELFKDDKGGATAKNIVRKTREFIKYGYIYLVEQTQQSLLELIKLEEVIHQLLPDIDISETFIPFSCVATDLNNATEKVFTKGSLRKCVLASSSIPGIFPPVEIDGIMYNDGGTVNVTPVQSALDLGANFIIACDVKGKAHKWTSYEKAKEIVSRCNYITGQILSDIQAKDANVIISPSVKHINWIEFDKIDFLIEKGQKAALAKLDEFSRKEKLKRIWKKIKKYFGFNSQVQKEEIFNNGEFSESERSLTDEDY